MSVSNPLESVDWIVLGSYPQSLINFRGHLIAALASKCGNGIAASATGSDPVLTALSRLGVKHVSYPIARNGLNPIRDIATYLSLRRLIGHVRPVVLMAYTIKPVIWSGLALRAYPQVRFTALITGLGYVFEGDSVFRRLIRIVVCRLYKASLARANAVVFQNPDNRDEFLRRGLVAFDKCHVVNGSGVDLEHYEKARLPDLKTLTFLLIARLLGEKGLREFASAARTLTTMGVAVRCVLVGPEDSSPDGISLSEVEGWHDEGILEYRGAVEDVRAVLRECDVFVLPSYHEGMPRTILEAMAIGRPILTTNVSGCRETVINGYNGWLVPKNDASALVEKMKWFISNRDRLEDMGSASRQLAEERFDVHKVNQDMIRIMGLA